MKTRIYGAVLSKMMRSFRRISVKQASTLITYWTLYWPQDYLNADNKYMDYQMLNVFFFFWTLSYVLASEACQFQQQVREYHQLFYCVLDSRVSQWQNQVHWSLNLNQAIASLWNWGNFVLKGIRDTCALTFARILCHGISQLRHSACCLSLIS